MDLLLNDLSLHGQFPDITTFREAIHRVMLLRSLANRFGRQLYSHRNILNCLVGPTTSLYQALQKLSRDEKRSVLQWLNRQGPFWEDIVQHSPNLYMGFEDEIVTGTAVGEAAYCILAGFERALVSFNPSNWQFSPLNVRIDPDSETETIVMVHNYWQVAELEAALRATEPPISSWAELEARSRASLQRLAFFADCYSHLDGQPFAPGAANRILVLLRVLDHLMGSVDSSGRRSDEGNRIYQDHFMGDKAWFSDSSDSEKARFEKELTFPNPNVAGEHLFCTWHGKVNEPPLRIHFAWPERPGDPLYVVYIGLKITKR